MTAGTSDSGRDEGMAGLSTHPNDDAVPQTGLETVGTIHGEKESVPLRL